MGYLNDSYRKLNPLKTDMYQYTMAKGYYDQGRQNEKASFYMHWRKPPFGGGYTVAAGLEGVIDFLKNFKFTDEDIAYLRSIEQEGQRLFPDDFLDYLKNMKLELDVDAVPEGTVMTGSGPVVRITGPLIQCQLVESAILNIMNSSSMIATRAARIAEASRDKAAFADFSLRRAATLDSGPARSSYIGGARAVADMDAARSLGIPATGTMAHSWIMSFQQDVDPKTGRKPTNTEVELNAFRAYVKSMPTNTVLLVDTFDPVQGIKNAINVAIEEGVKLNGVRLDSGDLFSLTWQAKEMLDKAAKQYPNLFEGTKIYLTNDLDEYKIQEFYTRSLDEKGKPFPDNVVYGVGTALGNPGPLGGVYKISAHSHGIEVTEDKTSDAVMVRTMKVAGVDPNDPTLPGYKSSLPGVALDTLRLKDKDGKFLGDVIIDTALGGDKDASVREVMERGRAIDIHDNRTEVDLPKAASAELLLKPVFRHGEYVYKEPVQKPAYPGGPLVTDLSVIQTHAMTERHSLPDGVRYLRGPRPYPLFLDPRINEMRRSILAKMNEIPAEVPSRDIDVFIDVQNGFARYDIPEAEGGSLYVPGGEKSGQKVAEMLKNTHDGIIVLSQDFHPASHISFMTNHPGVMQYRYDRLKQMGKAESEAMNPLVLPFDELVLGRDGLILGIKEGDRVRKVTLASRDGKTEGFTPSLKDKGRVLEVLDEYLEQPFAKIKGVSTQMLWSPHCVQGTHSADFVAEVMEQLPPQLREMMKEDTTSPDLEYHDQVTGNHFHIIRKGMNSEIDSYGIGLENDKITETTAPNVFRQIARALKQDEGDIKKANINIGGLATNFCVEFSHNNICDMLKPALRLLGIESETRFLSDISHGIPIPGGQEDPFSLKGAPARMAAYDKGNPTRIAYSGDVLRKRRPEPQAMGPAHVAGGPEHVLRIQ